MTFINRAVFRWWAFRQFLLEIHNASCWSDVQMAICDELWKSVVLGHINIGDFCLMDEDFPDLRHPLFVSMNRFIGMVHERIDEAWNGGVKQWGSYPRYIKCQRLHILSCSACREFLYNDARESARIRLEIEPYLKAFRCENRDL